MGNHTDATTDSPAMVLIQHVWKHNREGTGFSWTRLNGSMHAAVSLAISAGLPFGRDDFTRIAADMRVGYWAGEDLGEGWYAKAIELGHPSAYQSYEAWRGRRPLILDGERLHVGKTIDWLEPGKAGRRDRWTVTSFGKDQSHVVAVQYDHTAKTESGYPKTKIKRRCRITRGDLIADRAARKQIQAAAAARQQAVEDRLDVAKNGPTWFKVLMGGRSFHGGAMTWSLPTPNGAGGWTPGQWQEVAPRYGYGQPKLCHHGLHITKVPAAWWQDGAEVFEVELPPDAEKQGDATKSAVLKCRLVRRLSTDELAGLGITPVAARKTAVA